MSEKEMTPIQTAWETIKAVGGDKSKGAKYIADHPWDYGFSWKLGKLGRGTGKDYVEYNMDFPYIDISPEQVLLFVASFGPSIVSDALGGTSIKVSTDRVNRAQYDKNNKVTLDELKVALVTSVLLKVVSRGGFVTKFVDAEGNAYTSKADLDKALANNAKMKAIEAASAFMAMASENNIPADVARNMAMAQWPLAFNMPSNVGLGTTVADAIEGTIEE